MKKPLNYLFLLSILFVSCSKDNSEITEVVPQQQQPTTTPDTPPPPVITQEPENTITTPCKIDISDPNIGSILKSLGAEGISCVIDLKNQKINLPENTVLNFAKGDIINGTLNFTKGGKIDSRLLNLSTTIEGDISLINNDFVLFPQRWDIIEGKTDLKTAFKNHINIQSAVDLIKKLTPKEIFNRTSFSISRLDAYFESNSAGIGIPVITIPSDFNLNMSDNTVLRVFSVNDAKFTSKVIRLVGVTDITVNGGKIIGDRLERLTSSVGNVLFEIKGGQRILVENVEMSFGSITGLTINSVGRKGNPIADGTNYFPSKDVTIKNCVFDSNRSNNLSITDGEDITIQGCKLYKAGVDIGGSKGAAPRIGIVVEPVQGQVVERVIISGNEVKGSIGNSILAAFGNDITITGNTSEGGVGWNGASNVKIIDNPSIAGVLAGDDNVFNLSQSTGNEVKRNKIENAPTGILASNDDIIIEENQIVNCKVAIQMRNLKDSQIKRNTIISNVKGSFGINAQIKVDNVSVSENNVTLEDGRSFDLGGINDDEISKLTLSGNTFNCKNEGRITFSKGIDVIKNNFSRAGFGITSSKNINVIDNIIVNTGDNRHAFFLNNSSEISNITITGNNFESKAKKVSSAIRLFIVGDFNTLKNTSSNIKITKNTFKIAGNNFAVRSRDFNGVVIENNVIITDPTECCYLDISFNGDNSSLIGNTNASGGTLERVEVEGNNNTF